MKKIICILIGIMLILPLVSAVDIAYVLKNPKNINGQFTSAIDELGFSYELIDDSKIKTTDFSKYKMILVDNENINFIPVNKYPTLIADPDYYKEWSRYVGSTSNTIQLTAKITNKDHRITYGIPEVFQVYTKAKSNGISNPMYYLKGEKYNVEELIGRIEDSTDSVLAIKQNPRRVFFGITKSEYWTPQSRELFKNSIIWIIAGDKSYPPKLAKNIPDQTWDEDSSKTLDLNLYFSDPDGDKLSFSVQDTSDNQGITISFDANGIVKFEASKDWNGRDWVVFKAEDPTGLSTISNKVNLIVNPVNDNPLLNFIENIITLAGRLIKLTPSAEDIDGDQLSYSYTSPLDENGEWQTSENDAGSYKSTVTVNDGNGGSDSQEVIIDVLKKILINEFVSDPAQGQEWVEIYNPNDQSFSLSTCELIDGADNKIILSGVILKKGFKVFEFNNKLNNAGDIISLYCFGELIDSVAYGNWDDGSMANNAPVPGKGQSAGRSPDGKDTGDDSQDFIIFDKPTKGLPYDTDMTPPVVELLEPENNLLITDNREINFRFNVNDNVKQTLTCGIYIGNFLKTQKTVNKGINSILIDDLADGAYSWNVECSDGVNSAFAPNSNSFTLNAPDKPVINAISSKTVNEGSRLEVIISAYDPDGDTLSFTVENIPEGATFIDNHDTTANFSWIPNKDQSGNYEVNVMVEDSTGLKNSMLFKITVNNVKLPPSFSDAKPCLTPNKDIKIRIREPDDGDEFMIGEDIPVEIEIENNADEDIDFDVKVHFYDLDKEDSVESDEKSVDINEGDDERVEFSIKIPEDTDEDKDYAIFVKVNDEDNKTYCNQAYVEIDVEREDHSIIVDSVELIPTIVAPGGNMDVIVKVKNIGSNDEEGVYIQVENQELNILKKSEEFTIEEFDDDDKETKLLSFKIPENIEEKEYPLKVSVVFDDGEDSKTETFSVVKKTTSVSDIFNKIIHLGGPAKEIILTPAKEIQFKTIEIKQPVTKIQTVIVEKPIIQTRYIEKPIIQTRIVEKPVVVTKIVEKPIIQTRYVEKPVVVTQIVEKPVVQTKYVETQPTIVQTFQPTQKDLNVKIQEEKPVSYQYVEQASSKITSIDWGVIDDCYLYVIVIVAFIIGILILTFFIVRHSRR